MGGSIQAPNTSAVQNQLTANAALRGQALGNAGEFLKTAAGMIPAVSTPNISEQNKNILNQSLINAYQGRQVESLLDPSAAAMRSQFFPNIQKLTSPEAQAQRENQWLKTSGLERLFGSGTGRGTMGAQGLENAAIERGYENFLRDLQIQQGALGAAPSVGVNPSAAASQIEGARQQALGVQNAFNQNILQQGSGLMNQAFQSGSDLANAAMNLKAQDIQNQYAAQQANQNAFGALAGAGISGLGSLGGGFLAGPLGAKVAGSLF